MTKRDHFDRYQRAAPFGPNAARMQIASLYLGTESVQGFEFRNTPLRQLAEKLVLNELVKRRRIFLTTEIIVGMPNRATSIRSLPYVAERFFRDC